MRMRPACGLLVVGYHPANSDRLLMAASAEAFEAPTLERAFDQFGKNIGALAVVTLITVFFTVVSVVVYWFFALSVSLVAGEDHATFGALVARFLGEAGRLPFTILTSFFGVMIAAIPAIYFATGEVVTVKLAFAHLFARPWRYLLAGLLFAIVSGVGLFLCVLPGIVVGLTYPIYVNHIFTTDEPIFEAFTGSFDALYGSEKSWSFIGIQVLVFLAIVVLSVCTCGLAALVAVPVSCFYLQNAAYRWGLLS